MAKNNTFNVPDERALKLADAKVLVEFESQSNCDFVVQLESKTEYLKNEYQPEELAFLAEQYHQFFSDTGSFLSFLMPSTQGLILQFDNANEDENPVINGSDLVFEESRLYISQQWLNNNKTLTLSVAPTRITAWMSE